MGQAYTLLKSGEFELALGSLYAAHGERDFGNPAWEEAQGRFLVVRLSPFRDVERSTPHLVLHREIRDALPGAYVDFSFFPAARDRAALSSAGIPWLHGVASARGAADFDAILVSNAYTLELVNMVPALVNSGLPARRSERRAGFPIVALGGSNALAAGALFDPGSGDSYVDAMFFGEGEGSIGRIAAGLAEAAGLDGAARQASLEALSGAVPGLWPTWSRAPVAQARALGDAYPVSLPPLLAGEEAGTARLEISRGCPSFCSFCFEGWERKPYRERPLADILAEARRLKASGGVDSIELASFNFNTHARIVDIINGLSSLVPSVSFQSQRADVLARSPGLVRFEIAAGKRSFTVGVEGISSRARAYFSKGLSDDELKASLRLLIEGGARELKLFYILSGLEDDADLADFEAFVAWLKAAAGPRPPRIVFSVGELVRMPFTPLAYERIELRESTFLALRRRLDAVVRREGFEARAPGRFDEYCLTQVLALAPPGSFGLLAALAEAGHLYDLSLSKGAWACAMAYLDERGVLSESFLGQKPLDYPFPLPFLQPAVPREKAYARFLEAKAFRQRPSCLGAVCMGCGACDGPFAGQKAVLDGHELDVASPLDVEAIQASVAAYRRPHELWVAWPLERGAAAAPPAYAAARFRRRLFSLLPGLALDVMTAADGFLQADDGLRRLPGAHGDSAFRILSRRPLPTDELAAAGFHPLTGAPSGAVMLEPSSLRAVLRFTGAGSSLDTVASLISAFLGAAAVPHTLSKTGGRAVLAVSDKGRKKRNVLAASVATVADERGDERVAGAAECILELGPKFDLSALPALAARRRLRYETIIRLSS